MLGAHVPACLEKQSTTSDADQGDQLQDAVSEKEEDEHGLLAPEPDAPVFLALLEDVEESALLSSSADVPGDEPPSQEVQEASTLQERDDASIIENSNETDQNLEEKVEAVMLEAHDVGESALLSSSADVPGDEAPSQEVQEASTLQEHGGASIIENSNETDQNLEEQVEAVMLEAHVPAACLDNWSSDADQRDQLQETVAEEEEYEHGLVAPEANAPVFLALLEDVEEPALLSSSADVPGDEAPSQEVQEASTLQEHGGASIIENSNETDQNLEEKVEAVMLEAHVPACLDNWSSTSDADQRDQLQETVSEKEDDEHGLVALEADAPVFLALLEDVEESALSSSSAKVSCDEAPAQEVQEASTLQEHGGASIIENSDETNQDLEEEVEAVMLEAEVSDCLDNWSSTSYADQRDQLQETVAEEEEYEHNLVAPEAGAPVFLALIEEVEEPALSFSSADVPGDEAPSQEVQEASTLQERDDASIIENSDETNQDLEGEVEAVMLEAEVPACLDKQPTTSDADRGDQLQETVAEVEDDEHGLLAPEPDAPVFLALPEEVEEHALLSSSAEVSGDEAPPQEVQNTRQERSDASIMENSTETDQDPEEKVQSVMLEADVSAGLDNWSSTSDEQLAKAKAAKRSGDQAELDSAYEALFEAKAKLVEAAEIHSWESDEEPAEQALAGVSVDYIEDVGMETVGEDSESSKGEGAAENEDIDVTIDAPYRASASKNIESEPCADMLAGVADLQESSAATSSWISSMEFKQVDQQHSNPESGDEEPKAGTPSLGESAACDDDEKDEQQLKSDHPEEEEHDLDTEPVQDSAAIGSSLLEQFAETGLQASCTDHAADESAEPKVQNQDDLRDRNPATSAEELQQMEHQQSNPEGCVEDSEVAMPHIEQSASLDDQPQLATCDNGEEDEKQLESDHPEEEEHALDTEPVQDAAAIGSSLLEQVEETGLQASCTDHATDESAEPEVQNQVDLQERNPATSAEELQKMEQQLSNAEDCEEDSEVAMLEIEKSASLVEQFAAYEDDEEDEQQLESDHPEEGEHALDPEPVQDSAAIGSSLPEQFGETGLHVSCTDHATDDDLQVRNPATSAEELQQMEQQLSNGEDCEEDSEVAIPEIEQTASLDDQLATCDDDEEDEHQLESDHPEEEEHALDTEPVQDAAAIGSSLLEQVDEKQIEQQHSSAEDCVEDSEVAMPEIEPSTFLVEQIATHDDDAEEDEQQLESEHPEEDEHALDTELEQDSAAIGSSMLEQFEETGLQASCTDLATDESAEPEVQNQDDLQERNPATSAVELQQMEQQHSNAEDCEEDSEVEVPEIEKPASLVQQFVMCDDDVDEQQLESEFPEEEGHDLDPEPVQDSAAIGSSLLEQFAENGLQASCTDHATDESAEPEVQNQDDLQERNPATSAEEVQLMEQQLSNAEDCEGDSEVAMPDIEQSASLVELLAMCDDDTEDEQQLGSDHPEEEDHALDTEPVQDSAAIGSSLPEQFGETGLQVSCTDHATDESSEAEVQCHQDDMQERNPATSAEGLQQMEQQHSNEEDCEEDSEVEVPEIEKPVSLVEQFATCDDDKEDEQQLEGDHPEDAAATGSSLPEQVEDQEDPVVCAAIELSLQDEGFVSEATLDPECMSEATDVENALFGMEQLAKEASDVEPAFFEESMASHIGQLEMQTTIDEALPMPAETELKSCLAEDGAVRGGCIPPLLEFAQKAEEPIPRLQVLEALERTASSEPQRLSRFIELKGPALLCRWISQQPQAVHAAERTVAAVAAAAAASAQQVVAYVQVAAACLRVLQLLPLPIDKVFELRLMEVCARAGKIYNELRPDAAVLVTKWKNLQAHQQTRPHSSSFDHINSTTSNNKHNNTTDTTTININHDNNTQNNSNYGDNSDHTMDCSHSGSNHNNSASASNNHTNSNGNNKNSNNTNNNCNSSSNTYSNSSNSSNSINIPSSNNKRNNSNTTSNSYHVNQQQQQQHQHQQQHHNNSNTTRNFESNGSHSSSASSQSSAVRQKRKWSQENDVPEGQDADVAATLQEIHNLGQLLEQEAANPGAPQGEARAVGREESVDSETWCWDGYFPDPFL
ncbi:unnamed protein product [Polarella glacialis]|uniref:Uncharacterized protein n=1 Tax=Polarella glacialis TaxID=89957 RepID=A0A813F403_POLGL|nr:unnamed protein product [Polarella glacialis]